MELNQFEKDPSTSSLSKILEEYLVFVAKTGNTVFPWPKIKPVVRAKLDAIIGDFNTAMPEEQVPKMPNVDTFKFGEMKQRIFEQLESYSGIPFTMQRLCELLTQPKRHYKRVDKFMRGLEKVMLVVSTVEPMPFSGSEEVNTVREVSKDKVEDRKERESDSVSMESPSKRIRLSSAEEEESGPCDSQDGASNGANNEVDQDEVSVPDLEPTNESPGSSSSPTVEADVENMEIDTECTSSEARLSIPGECQEPMEGEEEGEACDSGTDSGTAVSTSAAEPSPVVEVADVCEEGDLGPEPSSTEGEVTPSSNPEPEPAENPSPSVELEEEEEGAPDCSSSDQAVVERETSSPTNSEAEPAEEVLEPGDEEKEEVPEEEENNEDSPTDSVQSSEEAGTAAVEEEEEVKGAADSSDEVVAEIDHEQENREEAEVEKKEDTSPDQSDTV